LRILICGGRDFNSVTAFHDEMSDIIWEKGWYHSEDISRPHKDIVIISGMARGADSLAVGYAKIHRLVLDAYPADWEKYGKSAGYIRNQEMLDKGKHDLVVAFPGGKGTQMMIKLARKAGIEVIEVET
jgi:hypothetical protein